MQLSVSLGGIVLLMCTARVALGITKTLSPYGPKMCWRLCHRSSMCFNYRFSAPMLSCHVLEKSPQRWHRQTDQERDSSVVSTRTPNVRKNTSLFTNHKTRVGSGGTGRYKGKRMKEGIIALSSMHGLRSLIIIPLQARQRPVKLPYIQVSMLTAMYYVSKEKKLLLVVDNPGTCVSYILYEPGGDNLAPCPDVVGISVDENRRLVFTISQKTHKIHSMTLTGKNRQIILTVKTTGHTRCIALDTKRKEIFIPYLKHVSVVSYEGQRLRNIYLGDMVIILTIDCQNGIIYFYDRRRLQYYWNNDKHVITNIMSQPHVMQVYNHDLYAAEFHRMLVVTRLNPKFLKIASRFSLSPFTILH